MSKKEYDDLKKSNFVLKSHNDHLINITLEHQYNTIYSLLRMEDGLTRQELLDFTLFNESYLDFILEENMKSETINYCEKEGLFRLNSGPIVFTDFNAFNEESCEVPFEFIDPENKNLH